MESRGKQRGREIRIPESVLKMAYIAGARCKNATEGYVSFSEAKAIAHHFEKPQHAGSLAFANVIRDYVVKRLTARNGGGK